MAQKSATFALNTEQTFTRIKKIYEKWEKPENANNFDMILLQSGKDEENSIKIKTTAIYCWLFGIDLVDTLLIFAPKHVILVASDKKLAIFSKLSEKFKSSPYNMLLFAKKPRENDEIFRKIRENLEAKSLYKIATLLKEQQHGPLVEETEKLLLSAWKHEKLEIAPFFIEMYMYKTPTDLNFMRLAGQSAIFLSEILVQKLENTIDNEISTTHQAFAQEIERKLDVDLEKIQEKLGFSVDSLEFTYTPIVQSGGTYDLRPQAESNDKRLTFDTILWNLCVKYMNFNCIIARTIFINATKKQQEIYEGIERVFAKAIEILKPGLAVKEFCAVISQELKEISEEIYEKRPNSYGFGIGLEFKESCLILSEKSPIILSEGMVLALLFNFNELPANSSKTYAIQLADTVIITSKGSEALTSKIAREYAQISYSLENPSRNPEKSTSTSQKSKKTPGKPAKNAGKPQKTGEIPSTSTVSQDLGKTRGGSRLNLQRTVEIPTKSLIEHQKSLISRKLEEYNERFQSNGFENIEKKPHFVDLDGLNCYKSLKEFPKELRKGEIFVDGKRFCVLFPYKSSHFVVHACLIKNVSKYVEQPFLYLRFNLHTNQEKIATKQLVFPTVAPEFCFKELCYRSTDHSRLHMVFSATKELLKDYKQQIARNSKENSQEPEENPDKLLMKNAVLGTLKDVRFRPTITGRKSVGSLELHENGLRFTSSKSERVEIFFSQVKHAFFQPCNRPTDTDYLIILHFHCGTPVRVNGKLHDDVQIFVEATVGASKDVEKVRRGDSEDEEEEEVYEENRRKKLNREFEDFVKLVEKESKGRISFDIPFKELGFIGMPAKGLVELQPTVRFLVALVEKPFFILDLEEIDFVCLERFQNYGKNFDIAFVYRDLAKPVKRICNVPKEAAEGIKNWLDKMDLIFAETKLNMNWPALIDEVKRDPKNFVDQGGWTALVEVDGEEEEEISDGDSSFNEEELEDEEDDDDDDEDFVDEEEESDFEEDLDEEEEDEEDEEDEEVLSDEESKKKGKPAKKRNL